MHKRTLYAGAAAGLLSLAGAAQAATVVAMKDQQGRTTEMWVQDDTARIESHQPGLYMLLNLSDGRMQMVNDQRRQVMDTGIMPAEGPQQGNQVDAQLTPQGDGPRIGGYDTDHYVLQTDGQKCHDYYISKAAMTENDLGDFMQRMSILSRMGSSMAAGLDTCDLAARQVGERLAELGLPMRVETVNGELVSEVVRVTGNADPGDRRFSPPEDYQSLDMQQLLQQQGQGQ